MWFVIYHQDREGTEELRQATRAAHLKYVADFRVLAGGPTLSEDGEKMNGSLLIVDLPDRKAAEEFVQADPYVRAKLFRSTIVQPWRKVIPAD